MRLERLPLDQRDFLDFVEELRFKFHKWDAYSGGELRVLPFHLRLSTAEHYEVVSICERVSRILRQVTSRLMNRPDLIKRLGVTDKLVRLLKRDIDSPYQIARYDLIRTVQGWMIPEFNEDAPGGFNEAIGVYSLFSNTLKGLDGGVSFKEALLQGLPAGERVGLVYATGYAEDLQHMRVLSDILREQGRSTFCASPAQLNGLFHGSCLAGQPFDWLFRFFPVEWYPFLQNLRAWERVIGRGVVVNPIIRVLRQSKMLYALWQEEELVEQEDLTFLNSCTPLTERFNLAEINRYRAEQQLLVLKNIFGRMGDAVTIGAFFSKEVWEKALLEAAKTPQQFIMQNRFVAEKLTFNDQEWYPAVGAYLVNGRFAGYYSRADRRGFTTNEAYYVATAVESA